MKAIIKPSKLKGEIKAPPSKSMAHRLLICAGLSEGESRIDGLGFSEDILATIDCLKALGAKITLSGDTAVVKGVNIRAAKGTKSLDCRECGSTLRFMIPLCMTSNADTLIYGSKTLMSRPLNVYEELAKKQNLKYVLDNGILNVSGVLNPGEYEVTGSISSQFISGLLFSLPLLDGDSTLKLIPPVESRPYIDMTLDSLCKFGIKISKKDEYTYLINGNQNYRSCDVTVEGDYSNAAFLEALNLSGNEVTVTGLNPESHQGDKIFYDFYKRISVCESVIDITDCPDLGPVLFAVSSLFKGSLFLGTKRLKWKESDRVTSMMQELFKCGINMTIEENRVQVHGGNLKAPGKIISGHNDHRVVMAMTVLLLKTGGTIDGIEAVRKSYPDFFETLKKLGAEVEFDGMDQ